MEMRPAVAFLPERALFICFKRRLICAGCALWASFVTLTTILPRLFRAMHVFYCGISAAPQQVQMYQPECGSRSHSRLSMWAPQFQQWLEYHTQEHETHTRKDGRLPNAAGEPHEQYSPERTTD